MADRATGPEGLMDGVPRGLTTRYLKEQTAPQARWMDPADILKHEPVAYDPAKPGGKILLGALGENLIGIRDNRHVLTVAGSRAGKSVGLINNLYFYDGSVLCTDPKGELASKTASRRAALGQKIYVLDPFEIVTGDAATYRAAYNPLSVLSLDNPFIVEDAAQIADALVIEAPGQKDPHWDEEARGIIGGFVLYVAASSDFRPEQRHLGTVRWMLNEALAVEPESGKYYWPAKIYAAADRLAAMGHEHTAEAIKGDIRSFYDKKGDELSGVLSSARRHTRFLGYQSIRKVLSGHSFDLKDLKAGPQGVTVYLCLPATRMGTCNRWLRLFANQLIDAMEREDREPDVPVLAALDEFPVLGFMRQLQDAAGQIASFSVKLWVIVQDWGQGQALYGERWESFAANAGIFQAFGNVDVTTTEYVSKRLGKTVVEVTRQGEASPEQRQAGLSGRTVSAELYDLLTPDEVSRLFSRSDPLKRQLVIWAGLHPMILERVAYYDDKSVHHRWFAEDRSAI